MQKWIYDRLRHLSLMKKTQKTILLKPRTLAASVKKLQVLLLSSTKALGQRLAAIMPSPIKHTMHVLVLRLYLMRTRHPLPARVITLIALLLLIALPLSILKPWLREDRYNIGLYENKLLTAPVNLYAEKLQYKADEQSYVFNEGYSPSQGETLGESVAPKIVARFDATQKAITVTDPVNEIELTFTPKFPLLEPKQNQNRIVYPLASLDGVKVYTLKGSGIKEDIILNSYNKDEISFSYDLRLPEGTEAKLEPNGSVAVYGVNSALLGSVTTNSETDAELLNKARANGEKTTLLFQIPAPFILEGKSKVSTAAKAWFELDGTTLTIKANGLKGASYPLSIDPSIYVETAAQLMRGNNETNVDFDVDNELIQKGSTTGARFDALTSTTSLPAARWGHGTTVAGGYIYAVGGRDSSSAQATVYWAKLNTSTGAIEAPNPGNGACSNWCNDSAYNLPSSRYGHSMVSYNGYLYIFGGFTSSDVRSDDVYIAKLGANGEPSLWHPTDSNQANWVYWYQDTDLPAAIGYAGAVAFNNRMYFVGGNTSGSTGGTTTVYKADIKPIGSFGSWSSSGTTAIPSARFGHGVQVYNNYLYVIGGNSSGTLQNSIEYIKINTDGTMASSWSTSNDFLIARMSWGGTFTTMTGGYLYISGGCSAIDAEGECTSTGITNGGTHQSDGSGTAVEVASINADGTVGFWGTISNVTNTRIGYGLVSWRNTVYTIGGCTAQNTTTGACTTASSATAYGVVNPDGDASTVATSVASATAPCSGGDPYNCNLPGTSYIGNMMNATAIMNGYLYVIGGCTANDCSTVSGNTMFAAIDSDGFLRRPATCAGGSYVDAFCVDSTDPISGGVAAAGTAVFGGRIYVIGGQNNSGLKGSIYHVAINNDGSLSGTWTAQTFTNLDATSVSYTFAYARANPSLASTYPGNLYIFGGCTAGSGVGCTANSYTQAVYKCNITPTGSLEEVDANDCTTTSQLQIGTVPGASGNGLGLHAGTVYANYIYLVGGSAPNVSELDTMRFAKIDNSNNIVAASGSTWQEPVDSSNNPVEMSTARARAAAFGYNGYLYTIGGYNSGGAGILSDIQFAKINVSNGNLEQFDISAVTINQRWGLSVPVSNSYAYVIGGCTAGSAPTCTTRTDVIQTFQIYNNDSGSPANYTSSANLFSTDRFGASSTIANGYIYVAGGCIGIISCDNATNIVAYAPLNSDGTIGTWSTTTVLPADRVFGQMEEVGGTLYYMGGADDSETAQSTVYYATPAGDGTISSWSTASGALGDTSGGAAVTRTEFSTTVWNNRIYVLGGLDGTNTPQSTVFISPQLNSGGNISADSWTSGTAFNVARNGPTAITYANNLYILGGHSGLNFLSDVQFTQINSDGSLDSWSYTTSLPRTVSHADGFAANGYMYIFGGKQSDIICTTNTYVAPISANTTIASGNNPTGIGEWTLTNERFSSERANLSAIYSDGKAYLMGGACGTLNAGTTTTVMTDDFDGAIDATMWTSTTGLQAGTVCGTVASGNALYSDGNNSAQAISKNVDVLYGGTVSFYLRIPTTTSGGCDTPEVGEDFVLQYSVNAGAGWTTIATYNEANFNTATLITETIPSGGWSNATRFRWYIPNADNNQDEWAIDDVDVEANDTPPLDELMEDDFDATIDSADWASTTGMAVGTLCGTISSGNSLYSNGGTAEAITYDHDMLYGGLVSFYLRIPTSSAGGCDQPESSEDVELQYSNNSGSSWTTFATYDQDLYNTATQITTAIPTAAYSTSVRFRWYNPNADASSDNWAIDDVVISSFDPILTYTGIHRAVTTSLLSQPQVAKYSRLIDTDTDVFPNTWLLNGVDNSIGARWSLKYRSMNDIDGVATDCGTADMSTWGLETNYGNVTLGDVAPYIPYDGSGNDIDCARYYYMNVTVDSTKAYGYPDDVTRGPTITDLSLYFTSDPNKRLRHGRTFTGGEQQPLDSPCGQTVDADCPNP